MFYLISPAFYWIRNKCDWVALGFIGFDWGFTEFFLGFPQVFVVSFGHVVSIECTTEAIGGRMFINSLSLMNANPTMKANDGEAN